jgi:diguanylate cyclase
MDGLTDEAHTDSLTGLPNRGAWEAHLSRAGGQGEELAFAILDLDHFKEFNDSYGHPAGDRLLKETAAAWRNHVRTGDFLARIGGEEFGLVLPHSDVQSAIDVVDRLRRSVTDQRTCSAGLTVQEPGESVESAIARAGQTLYQAKAEGRSRIRLGDPPRFLTS